MPWNTYATAARYARRCICTVLFVIAKRILGATLAMLVGSGVQFEEVLTPDGRRVLRMVKPGRDGNRTEAKKGSAPPNVSIDGLAQAGGGDPKFRPAESQEKIGRWGGVATLHGRGLNETPKRKSKGDEDADNSSHYCDFSTSGSENGDKKEDDDIDNTLANIFDERHSTENSRDFFRRFALDNPIQTVTPTASGESIGSDDPFLPPGLSPLALSLSPRRAFSGTCIQPGSAAASSSRSRMSFAKFLRGHEDNTPRHQSTPLRPSTKALDKKVPESSVAAPSQRSRFVSMSENIASTKSISALANASTAFKKNINTAIEPAMADRKSPTQIYRALSALSFWTPAPKVTVNIAAPVRRRRGGRRKEKEKEKTRESTNHEGLGERVALQEVPQN
ncbi:hypothetical protein HYPSUDRAFT_80794 [Hypholoma sublateritium FD-334 SS-4]|uniref:Uncharacterized protein n=1 Tax=Hypholoma sublateritium (strain FD-334 SS-4) TaxID=945553 RepID=A0A0D2ND97_HYPSF|nr:hypothetical protein HYPSUDRAFT_80794 [Hypholoma sublateritium FD-334 SS-4]